MLRPLVELKRNLTIGGVAYPKGAHLRVRDVNKYEESPGDPNTATKTYVTLQVDPNATPLRIGKHVKFV